MLEGGVNVLTSQWIINDQTNAMFSKTRHQLRFNGAGENIVHGCGEVGVGIPKHNATHLDTPLVERSYSVHIWQLSLRPEPEFHQV